MSELPQDPHGEDDALDRLLTAAFAVDRAIVSAQRDGSVEERVAAVMRRVGRRGRWRTLAFTGALVVGLAILAFAAPQLSAGWSPLLAGLTVPSGVDFAPIWENAPILTDSSLFAAVALLMLLGFWLQTLVEPH